MTTGRGKTNAQPSRPVHPFWQAAHRPFFLLAGLWAILIPGVWLWPGGLGLQPGLWHAHELLFGAGGAAVGGYLLTAVTSWTGRSPVPPRVIKTLAALWVVARVIVAGVETLPLPALLAGATAYLAALALFLSRELVTARVTNKAPLVVAVVVLAALDGAFVAHMRDVNTASWATLAPVLVFAVLISIIGGRAVPAFTANALRPVTPSHSPLYDRLCSGVLAFAAVLTIAWPGAWSGGALVIAGALQFWRMRGWRSLQARKHPSLFVLHAAWVWLPAGLVLTGIAVARPEVYPPTDAVHALTMGAMATMIVAISGRAAMTRTGASLVASRSLLLAFTSIWLAAAARLIAALVPEQAPAWIAGAVILWMSGWVLYLVAFRPALCGPVVRPVFSGPKRR